MAVFHVGVGFQGGVEFGADEGEEEVEEVDAEGVSDCAGLAILLRHGSKNQDAPMYQPCAKMIRSANATKTVAVPIHRYVT